MQLLILARKHTHRLLPAALLAKAEERSRMIRPSEASTSDPIVVTTDSNESRNFSKIFNRAKNTGSKVRNNLPLVPASLQREF